MSHDEVTSREPTSPKRLTASVKSLAHQIGVQGAQLGTHATPKQINALGELGAALLRDLVALSAQED